LGYFSLDNFITTEDNILPVKILSRLGLENQPENTFNPIYLYGNGGVGKTHLLMAAAQHLRKQGIKALYARAETFTQHVVSAIRSGEMNTVRNGYRNCDTLIIDDVHVLSRKSTTQEEFFHTFNALHLAGKQMIFSSNCSPQELQFIEPRLVSRFEWGIVLPVGPLKVEGLAQMLKEKALLMNYHLPPRLVEFFLNTFKSGTKSLTRALQALVLRMHMDHGIRDVSSHSLSALQAKAMLQDLVAEEMNFLLTPEKILQAVADHFGILPEDILSKAQSRDCVLPRQIAMYFCRSELKMTFQKAAELFHRDHSTVMTSVKLIERSLKSSEHEIIPVVAAIRKKFKASPTAL